MQPKATLIRVPARLEIKRALSVENFATRRASAKHGYGPAIPPPMPRPDTVQTEPAIFSVASGSTSEAAISSALCGSFRLPRRIAGASIILPAIDLTWLLQQKYALTCSYLPLRSFTFTHFSFSRYENFGSEHFHETIRIQALHRHHHLSGITFSFFQVSFPLAAV